MAQNTHAIVVEKMAINSYNATVLLTIMQMLTCSADLYSYSVKVLYKITNLEARPNLACDSQTDQGHGQFKDSISDTKQRQ